MLLFSALGKGEGNVLSVMKKLQNEPQCLKKCRNLVNYCLDTATCKGKGKLRKGSSFSRVHLSVISSLLSEEP